MVRCSTGRPSDWLEFQGSYQYANRDSPGYNNNRTSLVEQNAGSTELADLRRFDEATVHVNQFNLYGSLRPFHSSENPQLNSISHQCGDGLRRLQLPVLRDRPATLVGLHAIGRSYLSAVRGL